MAARPACLWSIPVSSSVPRASMFSTFLPWLLLACVAFDATLPAPWERQAAQQDVLTKAEVVEVREVLLLENLVL